MAVAIICCASPSFAQDINPSWYIQPNLSAIDPDPDFGDQTLLGVDALLMISRQRLRPFILFGVGAQRDKLQNVLRNVRRTSPYVAAGLGFQRGLTARLAMQVDLRTVRGRLRDDAQFGFGTNNKYLTVGFNYALGQPAAPPLPPPQPVAQPVA